jgi:phosphoadenosine phosphosulfate reductase
MDQHQIEKLNQHLTDASPEDILKFFIPKFRDKVAFSTSLGAEDQVLTHIIAGNGFPVRIFTLDTGRLFQETYDILDLTQTKYNLDIEVYFPDARQVEKMVYEKGINLFYESVENRLLCCHIRKTESLRRALHGMGAWISGLRREQTLSRKNIRKVEWDEQYGMVKINPLAEWTTEQVWDYIRKYHIHYNKLHDKGFPSIGCMPCTRAVKDGDDIRSGRWWWEMEGHKECGLHLNGDTSK